MVPACSHHTEQKSELVRDATGAGLWLRTGAATVTELDAFYPPGSYVFTLETALEGRVELTLTHAPKPLRKSDQEVPPE